MNTFFESTPDGIFWFRLLSPSKPNETHTLNPTNNEKQERKKKGTHSVRYLWKDFFFFFFSFLRHCSIYIALSPFYYCIVLSVCLFVAG
jgi:hypothetical protein